MLILIADDDRLVRYSLKSMLLDISDEFTFIEAKNGRELVSHYKADKPNMVFVDINMPLLDGLTAIEQCLEHDNNNSQTDFVVLTAYAEFEYAKRCISLGVTDYLLKPITPSDLSKIVNKIIDSVTIREKERLYKFQNHILTKFEVWKKSIDFNDNDMEMYEENIKKYSLFNIFLDAYPKPTVYMETQNILLKSLHKLEKVLNKKNIYISTSLVKDQQIQIIAGMQNEVSLEHLKTQISRLCFSLSNKYCCISAQYYMHCTLKQVYIISRENNFNYMHLLSIPKNVTPMLVVSESTNTYLLKFVGYFQNLLEDFLNADEVKFNNTLNHLINHYPYIPEEINIYNIAYYLQIITGNEIEYKNIKTLYISLKKLPSKMRPLMNLPSGSKIAKIQSYIAENYMNDISVSSISHQFDFTPNYLSTLFRNKTGKKFIEYLTEVRVSNAKRIMKSDHNISIKQVASLVGYTSPRHFATTFKKLENCYPSDYLNNLKNKDNIEQKTL